MSSHFYSETVTSNIPKDALRDIKLCIIRELMRLFETGRAKKSWAHFRLSRKCTLKKNLYTHQKNTLDFFTFQAWKVVHDKLGIYSLRGRVFPEFETNWGDPAQAASASELQMKGKRTLSVK